MQTKRSADAGQVVGLAVGDAKTASGRKLGRMSKRAKVRMSADKKPHEIALQEAFVKTIDECSPSRQTDIDLRARA